jgi:hypothetical protein
MDHYQNIITSLIESIKGLHPTVDRLSRCFREDIDAKLGAAFDKNSANDWRVTIYGDALVKLRIILENNFKVIETIGLVAVTRYIFELALWLELIEKDKCYALVYRRRLIDTQMRYYEASLKQLEREVALLTAFGEYDKQKTDEAFTKITSLTNPTSEQVSEIMSEANAETDSRAARSFSLYTDQAKTNGYGFQAHLVQTKAIPPVQENIHQLKQELDDFERDAANLVSHLPRCSKWEKMAALAEMSDEYDYIYSYTSKLLHCTPASVTTNQKNLEPAEVSVFLRYIHTKVRDVIDLALKQPECRLKIEEAQVQN